MTWPPLHRPLGGVGHSNDLTMNVYMLEVSRQFGENTNLEPEAFSRIWYFRSHFGSNFSLLFCTEYQTVTMRRMPPDGLCLYHAVNYAQNPELYEKVDMGTNAMPLGEGSGSRFQAAASLRGKLIATLISEGRHEQARRLSNLGSEGYAEE